MGVESADLCFSLFWMEGSLHQIPSAIRTYVQSPRLMQMRASTSFITYELAM